MKWRIRKLEGSWWAYRPGEPRGFRFKQWRSALCFVEIEEREAS